MNTRLAALSSLTSLVLALGAMAPAAAQSTWNLSTNECDPTGSGTSTTAGCTVGGTTATVTAWATKTDFSSSLLERATLSDQGTSGVGISSAGETAGSPNHAIDSSGKDELVLINFGTDKVSLTGVSTGWSQLDTDISILRWDGVSSGPDLTKMSIDGQNPNTGLLSSGWSLVRSIDMDGQQVTNGLWGNLSDSFNGLGSSSWWIISAYFGAEIHPGGAGSAGLINGGNLTAGNDYFKLLSFSGTVTTNPGGGTGTGTGIPEPTSLALVAAALLGAGYTRRRKRA
jgi:hypothetical protein